jgi:hypothetical protein
MPGVLEKLHYYREVTGTSVREASWHLTRRGESYFTIV